MAGKPKPGLDYAGWATNIFDGDTKIDRLLDAQGWIGFSVYFYLCQMAYKFDGYFYRWSYADAATTARRMGGGVKSETVKAAVGACLQIGLFDKRLFEENAILTSRGIQRRFYAAKKEKRRRAVIADYWLLEKNEESEGLEECAAFDDDCSKDGDDCSKDDDSCSKDGPERKEKESKGKGSKDIPSSGGAGGGEAPSPRRRKPSSLTEVQQARFNRFWAVYPRKQKLGEAEKAWAKIDPDDALTERIVVAVQGCVLNDFRFREERYTPLPATWLSGKEWENQYGGQDNGRKQSQGSGSGWHFRPSTGFKTEV